MTTRAQQAGNPFSLEGMANKCHYMLDNEGWAIVEGHTQSCPTLVASALSSLVGKHPDITTVANASFVVIEAGTQPILDMLNYHSMRAALDVSIEQLKAAKIDFHLSLGCPNCDLTYTVGCRGFDQIQYIAYIIDWPLDEVVVTSLMAALAFEDKWVPKSWRLIFGRELKRFDEWLQLRFNWSIMREEKIHMGPNSHKLIQLAR
jgi:hypothetical protein